MNKHPEFGLHNIGRRLCESCKTWKYVQGGKVTRKPVLRFTCAQCIAATHAAHLQPYINQTK